MNAEGGNTFLFLSSTVLPEDTNIETPGSFEEQRIDDIGDRSMVEKPNLDSSVIYPIKKVSNPMDDYDKTFSIKKLGI